MSDRGIIATYILSLIINRINPDDTSQFKLLEDPDSNKVNDLLLNNTLPVVLHDKLLTFRDTHKKFKLHGKFLKMITKKAII